MLPVKKKRQRSTPAMVHTAVVLPPEMIERLKQSDRGLSEEIRNRLSYTLFVDEFDARTRELGPTVMRLADEVRRHTGQPWHGSRQAFEVLEAALQAYLETLKPTNELSSEVFPDDPPTLGRAIARNHAHAVAVYEAARAALRERKREWEWP
jgi:hypothetical protein